MKTKVLFDKESIDSMYKGIETVHNAVSKTLGASGKNCIYRSYYSRNPMVTNDGVSIAKMVNPIDEAEAMGADLLKQAAQRTNDDAGDGPQDLNSKILTPTGWVNMGDIKVGDSICGSNGTTQKVLAVFPKGKKENYNVYFSGSSVVRCSKDHLWSVTDKTRKQKVLPLSKIIKNYKKENDDGSITYNYFVKTSPAEFSENLKEMPIEPYTLGVLLGDGSLSASGRSGIEISIGKAKIQILDEIKFPKGITFKSTWVDKKNYFRIKISGKTKEGLSLKGLLESIGLLGATSRTKFIPKQYLFSSIESRTKLLQGLIDTDGHINCRGLFEFSSVSKKLANDFADLCKSLGKQISIRKKDRVGCGGYSENPVYVVTERMGYQYGNKITKIEATGQFVEMRCLKVSNPDNLYFTDGYILTHNTSSAIVLAKALIDKGLEKIKEGVNPMVLKKEIGEAVTKIVEKIKEKSKPIKTDEDLFNIANISMENSEIAKIVTESVKKAGENGTVIVEESNGLTIEKEEIEGIKYEKGYISPYMATDPSTMEAVLNDCMVLVTDKSLSLNSDIFPLLEEIHKKGVTQLFLVCENLQGELLSTLIANRVAGKFYTVAVQKPNDPDVLHDIAALVGAEALTSEKVSNGFVPMHWNSLGKAKKIVVTKDNCLIIGGYGLKDKIEARIKSIKTDLKDKTGYKKEILQERLAKLVGGVVVLKVGAPTEAEMKYLKLKVDDAVASTKAASEEGIVIGGGKTLYEISQEKPTTIGEEVVYYACQQPIKTIIQNAGFEPEKIIKELKTGEVWNALTYRICKDPLKEGLIDPSKVERCALQNAASLAAIFLTSHCCIIDIPEKVKM